MQAALYGICAPQTMQYGQLAPLLSPVSIIYGVSLLSSHFPVRISKTIYPCTDRADPSAGIKSSMRSTLRLCGVLGFVGGFLLAYQRSSRAYRLKSPLTNH